jgi:apolipoprotein N-acyltransferase
LAWVALVPLLVVLERTPRPRSHRAFALGVVTGGVAFAGTLYWVTGVMTTYGGLAPLTAVGVNFLLVAYLALFIGLFAVLTVRGIDAVGPAAIVTTSAAWIVGELGRRYLFGGFPWALLGYSQVGVLPIAQLASVFGVYGVSFLVVLVNAALAGALVRTERRRLTVLGVAVGVAATVAVWGQWRLSRSALMEGAEPVRVAMIQGNVAQEDKRDPGLRASILETYLSRSEAAAADGARLIVWPESATPQPVEEDRVSRAAILDLTARTGADVVLGSEEVDRDSVARYYNAAFHVSPTGFAPATYRKIRLVPFGEYVPLRRWLFFAGRLVEGVADFTPGTDPVTFSIDGHRLGTAICYEVVYPDLVRSFVAGGSELLTTITNDAWFGETSAPYQHFAQAAMRAVEQGRYLVRSANTGISGVVDPYGRVLARTDLFEHATVVADVRWIRARTVYGRTGDLFAWGCAALVFGVVVAGVRRRPVRRGGDERGSDA